MNICFNFLNYVASWLCTYIRTVAILPKNSASRFLIIPKINVTESKGGHLNYMRGFNVVLLSTPARCGFCCSLCSFMP